MSEDVKKAVEAARAQAAEAGAQDVEAPKMEVLYFGDGRFVMTDCGCSLDEADFEPV